MFCVLTTVNLLLPHPVYLKLFLLHAFALQLSYPNYGFTKSNFQEDNSYN